MNEKTPPPSRFARCGRVAIFSPESPPVENPENILGRTMGILVGWKV
jgi:hypothetical protein